MILQSDHVSLWPEWALKRDGIPGVRTLVLTWLEVLGVTRVLRHPSGGGPGGILGWELPVTASLRDLETAQ